MENKETKGKDSKDETDKKKVDHLKFENLFETVSTPPPRPSPPILIYNMFTGDERRHRR